MHCMGCLYDALKLYRVYQEQSAVLGENVLYIELHQYKQTYLHQYKQTYLYQYKQTYLCLQLNSYGDIGVTSSAFTV